MTRRCAAPHAAGRAGDDGRVRGHGRDAHPRRLPARCRARRGAVRGAAGLAHPVGPRCVHAPGPGAIPAMDRMGSSGISIVARPRRQWPGSQRGEWPGLGGRRGPPGEAAAAPGRRGSAMATGSRRTSGGQRSVRLPSTTGTRLSRAALLYGGQDRMVPSAHGTWLAQRCRDAELWFRPDDGHVSVLSSSAVAALDWLVEHARTAA
jgi:hypothetical protein